MPPDDGFWSDNHERPTPVCPEAEEDRPVVPVSGAKAGSPALYSSENSELVSESQDLELKGGACPQG